MKFYICDVNGITEIWNKPMGIVLDTVQAGKPGDLVEKYVHGLGDQVK
jgi:hypothetical protein